MPGTALIAGVGPGFCESLAWKCAREGHPIGLFARSEAYLSELEREFRDEGFKADAVAVDLTDPEAVGEAFGAVRDRLGPIEVLAHTASTVTGGSQEELDPDRLEQLWRLYCYSGLCCFRAVREDLLTTEGTTLFFGASVNAGDFAFKSGKDAMRGLARALAGEYGPKGIHIAHVIIDGGLLNPDVYEAETTVDEEAYIDPEAAAETCYRLIEQPATARTFELDLHAQDRSVSY